MDPLSEALDVFELTLTSSARFEAAGLWALAFDRHDHIKVGAVLGGTCWIEAADGSSVHLAAGDCWLLAGGPGFTVSSAPGVTPVPQAEALPSPWASTVHYAPDPEATSDPEQRTVIVSSSLTLNSDATDLLIAALPSLTRISAGDPDATGIVPILELLNGESAVDLPGGAAMRRHLAHVLFLHALRFVYGAGQSAPGRGWLAALADPQIGRSLRGVHGDPARRWTVAELAGEARMSRSSFADRFHREVGLPPMEYAARWRVYVVAHRLRTGDRRIAEIASDLGYSSPSALSAAFTRHTGRSPAQYRSEHR
ncbi:AraC family transcriptional regulator [Streptomyces sp. TS71-3]|uniref:AraC family transcriptional regulator n=1 Tax=Streptomyces sp. TS71-3 TaxID=2733862 RepID=UPI001B03E4D3|nr:AraC family transcriptional regulator [Streptomyces sp. TS71-3]GHJ41329.1 AraC family transcriptional regulator [Streptomyces sp. TS71-3]